MADMVELVSVFLALSKSDRLLVVIHLNRDEKVNAIIAYPLLHALHHSHSPGSLKPGGLVGKREMACTVPSVS